MRSAYLAAAALAVVIPDPIRDAPAQAATLTIDFDDFATGAVTGAIEIDGYRLSGISSIDADVFAGAGNSARIAAGTLFVIETISVRRSNLSTFMAAGAPPNGVTVTGGCSANLLLVRVSKP